MNKTKRCGLIFAPMNWGTRYVGVGVCCTLGCTDPHYLGGMDGERRPKRTFDSAVKAWQACSKANFAEAKRSHRLLLREAEERAERSVRCCKRP